MNTIFDKGRTGWYLPFLSYVFTICRIITRNITKLQHAISGVSWTNKGRKRTR